jgi:hypothetical protein
MAICTDGREDEQKERVIAGERDRERKRERLFQLPRAV